MMEPSHGPPRIGEVGSVNASMRKLLSRLEKVAPTPVPLVLLGETGVGKTWFARAVHEGSGLKGDFVHVPCPSVPEPLLESELFGHLKGSFTGADRSRTGRLATARNGTLFLDEIGDLPAGVQAKLLVALETGEFWPVGSDRPIRSGFRLITATNKDLLHQVKDGRFRSDLYHRLGVARFVVPPLRRRREDIPALAAAFLAEACREQRRKCDGFEPPALDALTRHPWPGNIRELRSLILLATATRAGPRIRLVELSEHLDPKASTRPGAEPCPDEVLPWKVALEQFERRYWVDVLAAAGGSRRRAAALAGVSERLLYSKLRIHRGDFGLNDRADSARSFTQDVQIRTDHRPDLEAQDRETGGP